MKSEAVRGSRMVSLALGRSRAGTHLINLVQVQRCRKGRPQISQIPQISNAGFPLRHL